MFDLAGLGVTRKRRFLSSSGDEVTADSAERTEHAYTLPKSTEIQATFSREGLGNKLRKIFKREVQTGDGLFDEAVNIKTDTAETTAALLESRDLRAVIERLIANGGALEIDGAIVKVDLPGRQELDAEVEMLLVTTLVSPAS
ncbi:MAG: hypothetical protein JWO36_3303 [Myxococcales bacterium]|nr:hypothetical protein [Myxococcales bacterium]